VITALQCAQLCEELYEAKTPDVWSHFWTRGDIVCALKHLPDDDVVVYRGSETKTDWLRDFNAIPQWDPEIGFCHGGFLTEMDTALAELIPNITRVLTVTGHSLGGARARIAAAKLAYRGFPVSHLCTFGSPRPGFANVRRVIEKSGMKHESFRNGNDPVCLVPFPLPLLPFEHTENWTAFWEHAPLDELDPTRDHDIHLYIAGCGKLIT
jgi:hypothetical protein